MTVEKYYQDGNKYFRWDKENQSIIVLTKKCLPISLCPEYFIETLLDGDKTSITLINESKQIKTKELTADEIDSLIEAINKAEEVK